MIGTRTIVDGVNDPVVQSLVSGAAKGEMIQGNSKMLSGLTIDLMTRKRVKIFGRMIAGSLGEVSHRRGVRFAATLTDVAAAERAVESGQLSEIS